MHDMNNIGERVIVMFPSHIASYLKILSYNCFVRHFPDNFIDMANDNYEVCLKCVEYAPAIYFKLSKKFQNNKLIKKCTINAYKKHDKFNEIYVKNNIIYLKKLGTC